jgi:hypothetical protein
MSSLPSAHIGVAGRMLARLPDHPARRIGELLPWQ